MTGVAVYLRRSGNVNRGGRRGLIDLTNAVFGALTVERRATVAEVRAVAWTNFTSARWICRCVCGARRVVLGSNLRNGKTRSCGKRSC